MTILFLGVEFRNINRLDDLVVYFDQIIAHIF